MPSIHFWPVALDRLLFLNGQVILATQPIFAIIEPRYMNKAFVEEMKGLLVSEKAKLEGELGRFAHRNPKAIEEDFDVNFPNLGDKEDENASEVATYSDNLSLEDELEKQLRDVLSAMKMIEAGTYGTCKYCKQEIAEARLRARPTSSSCVECKKTLTQEV